MSQPVPASRKRAMANALQAQRMPIRLTPGQRQALLKRAHDAAQHDHP